MALRPPHEQAFGDYGASLSKWSLEQLPWDLSHFTWSKAPQYETEKILNELEECLKEADAVAIATDNDPSGEGDLLAWEALDYCHWSGQTYRLQIVDESPKSIQRALQDMRPAVRSKEGMLAKGTARERWDFASMQLTRAATLLAQERGYREKAIRQGRLKSVIVRLVGDQQNEWESYVKKPFYEPRFKDENGNVFKREDTDLRRDNIQGVNLTGLHPSCVIIDSCEHKTATPPKLLDLAALSGILAKEGYKPKIVSETYQAMYEAQYVSYPRTEDKVVTPEQYAELLPLSEKIAQVIGIDCALLVNRTPRKTHVKDGGAHGANRPGPKIPISLAELNEKFGKAAAPIYTLVAKSWLAMFGADMEYDTYKAHIRDFEEYKGTTSVITNPGYKQIFNQAKLSNEKQEGDEKSNTKKFGQNASPFVFEGANKRAQRPTIKWLVKQLEKAGVGTGATRTSTISEISGANDSALLHESKGVLSLTNCGKISYALLEDTWIAECETTVLLQDLMKKIEQFQKPFSIVYSSVTKVIDHDVGQMKANAQKLTILAKDEATIVATCPLCGCNIVDKGPKAKTFECESNKHAKENEGKWTLTEGCGFGLWKKQYGKTLTTNQAQALIEKGQTGVIKGFKAKSGKSFDAKLVLSDGKVSLSFDPHRQKPKVRGKNNVTSDSKDTDPPSQTYF